MPTYSLTLRENENQPLTWSQLDDNFLYLDDKFSVGNSQIAVGTASGLTSYGQVRLNPNKQSLILSGGWSLDFHSPTDNANTSIIQPDTINGGADYGLPLNLPFDGAVLETDASGQWNWVLPNITPSTFIDVGVPYSVLTSDFDIVIVGTQTGTFTIDVSNMVVGQNISIMDVTQHTTGTHSLISLDPGFGNQIISGQFFYNMYTYSTPAQEYTLLKRLTDNLFFVPPPATSF